VRQGCRYINAEAPELNKAPSAAALQQARERRNGDSLRPAPFRFNKPPCFPAFLPVFSVPRSVPRSVPPSLRPSLRPFLPPCVLLFLINPSTIGRTGTPSAASEAAETDAAAGPAAPPYPLLLPPHRPLPSRPMTSIRARTGLPCLTRDTRSRMHTCTCTAISFAEL